MFVQIEKINFSVEFTVCAMWNFPAKSREKPCHMKLHEFHVVIECASDNIHKEPVSKVTMMPVVAQSFK